MGAANKLSNILFTAALGVSVSTVHATGNDVQISPNPSDAANTSAAASPNANTAVLNLSKPDPKIIQQSPQYCWEEMLGIKKLCLTSRVIEVEEMGSYTAPIEVDVAAQSSSSGITKVHENAASFGAGLLRKNIYLESTLCQVTPLGGECRTTRSKIEDLSPFQSKPQP